LQTIRALASIKICTSSTYAIFGTHQVPIGKQSSRL